MLIGRFDSVSSRGADGKTWIEKCYKLESFTIITCKLPSSITFPYSLDSIGVVSIFCPRF